MDPNDVKPVPYRAREREALVTAVAPSTSNVERLQPVTATIDLVRGPSGGYFILNPEDVSTLRDRWRVVPTEAAGLEVKFLMDEEVAVLLEHGVVRLLQLKEDSSPPPPSPKRIAEIELTRDEDWFTETATRIMEGRRAKRRKLNAENEDAGGDGIDEKAELQQTIEELKGRESQNCSKRIAKLPPARIDTRLESYEEVRNWAHFPATSTPHQARRLVVFRDLWRRGHYMTSGSKHGCDFLCYEDDPSRVHSRYLVDVADIDEPLHPLRMITLQRLAGQVRKTVLLAIVSPDSNLPTYMHAEWWRSWGARKSHFTADQKKLPEELATTDKKKAPLEGED